MKVYQQVLQLVSLFANAVPIIIAILYYAQGGDDWGGKIPLFIGMTLIFMIIAGIIGLGTLGRVFYQLNINKSYDGSQGSIRAILFVGLLYIVVAIMGGISISQYVHSNDQSCSLKKIYNLWDQEVYEEGQQAYNNFCHQCQCRINETDLKYYSITQLESMNYSTYKGAEDISKCRPEEGQLQTSTFDRLKKMEKSFLCAGFCQHNPAFTFLGTSQGFPKVKNGCFYQVSLEFNKMRIVVLSISLTLIVLMILTFIASVYMRRHKIKEIMDEYGVRLYEPINSISIIGVSNIDDWRGHDNSQSDQQRSNASNKNNLQHMRTNYQQQAPSDNSSNFGQSQHLDKNIEQIQINKMKSVRKAFRSMHNPKSTFKK